MPFIQLFQKYLIICFKMYILKNSYKNVICFKTRQNQWEKDLEKSSLKVK